MNYTRQMRKMAFDEWSKYDKEGESDALDLLNDEYTFRFFGDGLVDFLQTKESTVNYENLESYIKKCCKENDVEIKDIASRNTLKSWCNNGPRPKKGEDSRESMFALAFALQLNVEETVYLFHNVYLDRAFDFRNENELIYYHCISQGKSWKKAKELISKIEYAEEINDKTLYTIAIQDEIKNISDENDLLDYIKEHRNNLNKNNVTAKKYLARLIDEVKKYVVKEAQLPGYEDWYEKRWKKEDTVSINFMYSVITETTPFSKKGTITIFKNARLPKEIKNRFPEAMSFSEKEPTYESMRKMLIMLFSYAFWYQVQYEHKNFEIEDYTEQLNALLNECGLSELYYGNPHDWLYLFCSNDAAPLRVFREILYNSVEYEDKEDVL